MRTHFPWTRVAAYALCCLVLLGAGTAPARDGSPGLATGLVDFSPQVLGTGVDETHAAAAADFDGDGDVDVVATDYVDGAIFWYENDGLGGFSPHTLDDALAGAYPVSVADLDLDGDVDVLAAGYLADVVAWYENDGTGSFTRCDVDTAADGAHSVVAGDMDGDGDRDLLTTRQDAGQVVWYENVGLPAFVPHLIDTTATGAKRAEFVDLDGDGDQDVVTASFFLDEVAWLENDGTQVFTRHVVSDQVLGAYFVAPADVDGDGDPDILAASQLDDGIRWFENLGGTFATHVIDDRAEGARMVLPADLDGDGDLDAVASSVDDSTVGWYQNDGRGQFARHVIDAEAPAAYGVWVADVDRDGLLDVLAAARDAGTVTLYRQTRRHLAAAASPDQDLVLGPGLLRARIDAGGAVGVLFTLASAPAAGEILLDGVPLSEGEAFTQDDVNRARVRYRPAGPADEPDPFVLAVGFAGSAWPAAEADFAVLPSDRLLAHWPLDEASGMVAADVAGNLDAQLEGGPAWDPAGGMIGGALAFDGLDDRAEIGILDAAGNAGLTITAWVNLDTDQGDRRLVSRAVGVAEQDHYWMVSTYQGLRLRYRLRTDEGTSTLISSEPFLVPGDWTHVAATYDHAEMRLYADGTLVASMPKIGSVAVDPAVPAAIGNQPDGAGNEPLAGRMDDVRIYDRALGPDEISLLAHFGAVSATGPDLAPAGPRGFRLEGLRPNPFNPRTTVRFTLDRAADVRLEVFDLGGRRIRRLADGRRGAGTHEVPWDGRDDRGRASPSGAYLCRLTVDGVHDVVGMTLVR